MSWLGSPIQLAAELGPVVWTLVAAERTRDRAPRLVAAASFPADAASLVEPLRQFRVGQRLPLEAAVVLWPAPGESGVAALDSRTAGCVSMPKARVIRERVRPLVRCGAEVRDVLLPHEAAARLASLAAWPSALVIVMQAPVACLAVIDAGAVEASYLSWEPIAPAGDETEGARLLARYQFAARLVPYVRERARDVPDGCIAVCGRFPDLRSAMLPIVEELDREVEVLDAGLVGERGEAPGDPGETGERQLAWAVAAGAFA